MTRGPGPLADPAPGLDPPPIDDAALEALALAADPDAVVGPDAVCLWDLAGWDQGDLLPSWYMPAPMRGRTSPAWQRWVIGLIVASFLLIDGYGLCSTYGWVSFG
jgi:hypothetical protein